MLLLFSEQGIVSSRSRYLKYIYQNARCIEAGAASHAKVTSSLSSTIK